jgi:MerR family transcriptional regulator, thiopeptide resistance regulator
MEYSIQKLSQLAGVSTRTLRYYDEIDLLKPARINSSGYRIYGTKEVDRLQQILFYKQLGFELQIIKKLLLSPQFDPLTALKQHHKKLLKEKEHIDALIETVEKTIANKEGRIQMNDQEKFNGFKQKLIQENEDKFGKETREKYGEETVNQSNQKMMRMSEEQYQNFVKLGDEILHTLKEAFPSKDPASELAQKAADLHRQWLEYTWKQYSKEAHRGLAQMYMDDERFKAYYDQVESGLAQFLKDAIFIYTA